MRYDQDKEIKKLHTAILTGVGRASLCWRKAPEGVFDTDAAVKVGEELLQTVIEFIEHRDKELQKAYLGDKN